MSPVLAGWDPAKDRLLSGLTITAEGVKVGPCLVNGKIGQGGMGAVYRARHTMLNLDVAVKILPFHLVEDNQAYVQRFQREAQAAAVVSHQNLVRVFEMGCEKDIYFLILEFVNGESAHARLARKKKLDEGEALRIIRDASVGLGAAHGKNIIHRDVKPDNILVGQDGTVKLADLGLAKIADADFAMTLSNVAMGTPQFMSPEQIKNSKTVTVASDIWAMGVSLYYLLTAQYPFNADNLIGLLNIINDATPSVIQVRGEVAPGTQAIINKCLEKDPGLRYKTANELVTAIDSVLLQLALPSDLTVPAESCLSSKLAPYAPSSISALGDGSAAPPSDAPTLIGQGPTSSRGASGAGPGPAPAHGNMASDGSYTSTLKLPPKGTPTPPQLGVMAPPGSGNQAGATPVSTSAVTAASHTPATLVTGATTLVDPGRKSKLLPILIALLITLPITGYGLYWGLKVKPYSDAVAAAQEFEHGDNFAAAASAWKRAQELSPSAEATDGFTRNDKLAAVLDQIRQAESARNWQAVGEHCESFLKLKPGFPPIQDLAAKARLEIHRAELVGGIVSDSDKVLKASNWDFNSKAYEFRKRLESALEEFPDSLPLQQVYTALATRIGNLEYLDRALPFCAAALKSPGLTAVEKAEWTDLQEAAQEARGYAYRRKVIDDPLEEAHKKATARLDSMVKELQEPNAAVAEARKLLTDLIPTLPTDAEDRDKTIQKELAEFDKEVVGKRRELSQAAQRVGKFELALAALTGIEAQIDDYYKNLYLHSVAFLKLMLVAEPYRAKPLDGVSGLAQDGNGQVVAPENLPVADLRQIRILRVVDQEHVVAMINHRFVLTTLKFAEWKQVTEFPFDQDSTVLSGDLRLSAAAFTFTTDDKKPQPPDARVLSVFEQAGDDRNWTRTQICAPHAQMDFNPAGTELLLVGHQVDGKADVLFAFDVVNQLNNWNYYGRGFRVLKEADAGQTISDPAWLPDGVSVVYGLEKDGSYAVQRLQTKSGKVTTLLTLRGEDGAAGPRALAVDPSGKVLAVYNAGQQGIDLIATEDGSRVAKIAAQDVNFTKTGAGLWFSTDGKWLVYKAMDGETPVYKKVGLKREGGGGK